MHTAIIAYDTHIMGNGATMDIRDVGTLLIAVVALMTTLTFIYWRLVKGDTKSLREAITGTKEDINKRIDDANSTIKQMRKELTKVWEIMSRSVFNGNVAEKTEVNVQSDVVEQQCKGKLSEPVITP